MVLSGFSYVDSSQNMSIRPETIDCQRVKWQNWNAIEEEKEKSNKSYQEGEIIRKTRKILATLLTFAMLFGSSLTVFADEGEEYYHYGSNISNIGNTEINASISQIPTQISQTLTHNPNGNTPSSNPVEEPTKIEEVHEHSYSWVTVQEATTEQDGMEEYRCSCGAVA